MNDQKTSLSVPVAIIIAGALIAFGIYWTGRGSAPAAATVQQASTNIKGIQSTDHVLGNPKAKIVIVEYSDPECPYCKIFNSTLHQILTAYDGQVAWVFRYYPVHQNSVAESAAAECAAELGGNNVFWKYMDEIFQETKSNNGLDLSALPQIASNLGLDATKFNTCLSSGKYDSKITNDRTDVTNAGAQGTPYSVIFAGQEQIPITQGAIPFDGMKNIIDTILKNS